MIEPIYKIIESMKAQRLLSTDLAGIQWGNWGQISIKLAGGTLGSAMAWRLS